MGDTPRGHLPVIAPVFMSLGAPRTNPYNLGTHFDFHQQSPAVDPNRYLVKSSYAPIPISQFNFSHTSTKFHDLREVGSVLSPT